MEVIRSILDEAVGRNLRLSLKNNQDNKKGKLTGNLKKVESNNGLVDCTLLTEKNITVVVRFFDGSYEVLEIKDVASNKVLYPKS